ncbi:MAG: hypothetical protein NW206_20045 [Hyphomonadaceae bacterium]|nr:hypothetical protein [Hyphomonadaceae bacterium]
MREDFCAMILTHGRPDRLYTVEALRSHGYTGKLFLVIDDEDKTADRYRELYGDKVLTFSKSDIARRFDEGDNFNDRRSIFYARNAAFELAREVGCRFFVQLDDDYSGFYYRFGAGGFYGSYKLARLDWLLSELCDFLAATPFAAVAMSQGGDHIGGGGATGNRRIRSYRKAMNSFVCDTLKPFRFIGRINEDVNTYTAEQRRGVAFLTFMAAQVNQKATQSNAGGMTELYLDAGTYLKTFYSVMYAPSAVKVGSLGDPRVDGVGHTRIHHAIDWDACAPLILREQHRKTPAGFPAGA